MQGRKNHCRSLKQVCNRARKPLSYKTQGERELAQNQPQTAYNLQNHHHQQMAASNDLHTNCSNTTTAHACSICTQMRLHRCKRTLIDHTTHQQLLPETRMTQPTTHTTKKHTLTQHDTGSTRTKARTSQQRHHKPRINRTHAPTRKKTYMHTQQHKVG